MRKAALVYQCGIANVFELDDDGVRIRRLLQHDFRTCEAFARGLRAAGVTVVTAHSDVAGDVASFPWSNGPGDIFSDAKSPV